MRCLACSAEMMLVRVHHVQDDTKASPNIEDHSFMCLECRAIERYLIRTRHGREVDGAPPIVPASVVREEHIAALIEARHGQNARSVGTACERHSTSCALVARSSSQLLTAICEPMGRLTGHGQEAEVVSNLGRFRTSRARQRASSFLVVYGSFLI